MTQEDKDLLLKDICARLPYKVICTDSRHGDSTITEIDTIEETVYCDDFDEYVELDKCKPYLRPMSSMTEEEGKELERIFSEIDAPCWVDIEYGCVNFAGGDFIDTEIAEVYTDWLIKKMFDYRGLIPMRLALEAPKDMYCTNQKWTPLRSGLKENEDGQIVGGLKL